MLPRKRLDAFVVSVRELIQPSTEALFFAAQEARVVVHVGHHIDPLTLGHEPQCQLMRSAGVTEFGELIDQPALEYLEQILGLGLQVPLLLAQFGVQGAHGAADSA